MLFNPQDYTTVFLSYDEPNCEDNYRHLLTLNPNALRVHGVKGSDTAHKEVAKLSKTDSVIVVDGDNFVKPFFFNTEIELPFSVDMNTCVLSFSAYNTINGLSYGNGGIKVWPVDKLLSMKTHENGNNVDFELSSYIELDIVASEIHFASSYQAFRAGFREGVKLSLDKEKPISFELMDKYNFDRLWMWSHVGMDTEFGEYAINGMRLGLSMMQESFDYLQIRDFDFFNSIINQKPKTIDNHLFTDPLSKEESKLIRENYINPNRNIHTNTTRVSCWAEGFRECAKTVDENKKNMLCTMGRELPNGKYKIDGARAGRNYNGLVSNLYNYVWLQEQYDRFYKNTI